MNTSTQTTRSAAPRTRKAGTGQTSKATRYTIVRIYDCGEIDVDRLGRALVRLAEGETGKEDVGSKS